MLSCLWRAVCGLKQGMYAWGAADGGISFGPVHFQAADGVCIGRNTEDKLEEQCHK